MIELHLRSSSGVATVEKKFVDLLELSKCLQEASQSQENAVHMPLRSLSHLVSYDPNSLGGRIEAHSIADDTRLRPGTALVSPAGGRLRIRIPFDTILGREWAEKAMRAGSLQQTRASQYVLASLALLAAAGNPYRMSEFICRRMSRGCQTVLVAFSLSGHHFVLRALFNHNTVL